MSAIGLTRSENELHVYSTRPADVVALTMGSPAAYLMCGYSAGPGSTTLSAAVNYGDTSATVASSSNFFVGEKVLIGGAAAGAELATVSVITTGKLTFANPLKLPHASAATVVGTQAAITPTATGRIRVACVGSLTGNTTTDTPQTQIKVIDATSAAGPANGAAVTGTGIGNISYNQLKTDILSQNFKCEALIGGDSVPVGGTYDSGAALTIGTPYLFDLACKTTTTTTGTIQPTDVSWFIEEV